MIVKQQLSCGLAVDLNLGNGVTSFKNKLGGLTFLVLILGLKLKRAAKEGITVVYYVGGIDSFLLFIREKPPVYA